MEVLATLAPLTLSAASSDCPVLREGLILVPDSQICWNKWTKTSPTDFSIKHCSFFIDCSPSSYKVAYEKEGKGSVNLPYLCFIQKRLNSVSGLLLSSLRPPGRRDNFWPVNRNTPTLQAVTEVIQIQTIFNWFSSSIGFFTNQQYLSGFLGY